MECPQILRNVHKYLHYFPSHFLWKGESRYPHFSFKIKDELSTMYLIFSGRRTLDAFTAHKRRRKFGIWLKEAPGNETLEEYYTVHTLHYSHREWPEAREKYVFIRLLSPISVPMAWCWVDSVQWVNKRGREKNIEMMNKWPFISICNRPPHSWPPAVLMGTDGSLMRAVWTYWWVRLSLSLADTAVDGACYCLRLRWELAVVTLSY